MSKLLSANCPLLGFAAYSGTGKTTLLEQLIPILRRQGLRIGLVKHSHHKFEVDKPGKDSYRLRMAGAEQVLLASQYRLALMIEKQRESEPRLDEILHHLDQDALDLILVEGFRHVSFPKIELHRPELNKPLLCSKDDSIIAIAHDAPLKEDVGLPRLDLNVPKEIAAYIVDRFIPKTNTTK